MIIPEVNQVIRLADFLLKPFMWFLGGFNLPIQETHIWHGVEVNGELFPDQKGVLIDLFDNKARFGHNSPFGLFHMPIFGGLKRYVILKADDFKDHWHIVWKAENFTQIHKLRIINNGLMLLTGKGKYFVFGIDDAGKLLKLKIANTGYLGDGRYNKDIRLF